MKHGIKGMALFFLAFVYTSCASEPVVRVEQTNMPATMQSTALIASGTAATTRPTETGKGAIENPSAPAENIQQTPLPPSAVSVTQVEATSPSIPIPTVATSGQTINWERVVITLPPNTGWITGSQMLEEAEDLPVLVSGSMVPSSPAESNEAYYGPRFSVVAFAGSLESWLNLVRSRASDTTAINERTVEQVVIDGHQGVSYQRVVTGVSDNKTFAIQLGQDHLLLIATLDTTEDFYKPIIDRLKIK